MGARESARAKGPARAGPSASSHVAYNNLAVQAAEQPDQQNDWQRNAYEPKQQPASHDILLCCLIKDCILTTRGGGSSVVAARGRLPRGLSRRRPWLYCARARRGGRVAEGARLESVYTGNRIVGSNPTPSASTSLKPLLQKSYFLVYQFHPTVHPTYLVVM